MSRHRTVLSPRERWRAVLRWALRALGWLVLGMVVGAAAWGALTWAGSEPQTARRVALVAAVVAAVAAGVATSVPGPGGGAGGPQGPSAS
jgi:NhaP-type Na+/H+ or K+/H+ antiporter